MPQQTMEPAAENAALVEAGYAAFGRGDTVTLSQQFSPKVVWHVKRLGVLGGDHRGWPEVLRFFGQSTEMTDGTFAMEVEEILANDTGAAAFVRSTARRGTQTLDDRQVHLFHIEGGRVVEVWQFVGDGVATQAFWS